MFRLFLGLMVVVLFVGCASKEEESLIQSYKEKQQYHKNLQQTEKVEIFENNISIALITGTYIYTNSVEKNDTRDEVFILGITFENPELNHIDFDKNSTINAGNSYILTLNGKSAIKVKPLSEDNEQLKDISFVTLWGQYYKVTFPHTGNRFSLILQHKDRKNVKLNFSKIAKFVYTKKGF